MQDLGQEGVQTQLEEAYWDEEGCNFNLGLLACISKQTTGKLDDGTPYTAPEDTRPISMVDTANRLLANAARIRWEQHLARWISAE